MAESAESAPKASEFFLGVVDLFGIVLPGALTTVVIAISSQSDGVDWSDIPKLNTTQWVIFIVVAYIVGNLISGLGGMILDPLYDGFYQKRFIGEMPRLRRRAERAAFKVLGDEFYLEDDNRLEWAESLVRLTSSSAAAHIDRIEADSKFFRSLVAMLMVTLPALLALFSKEPASLSLWCYWAVIIIPFSSYLFSSRTKHAERGKNLNKQIKDQLKDPIKARLDWPDKDWFNAEDELAKKESQQCKSEAWWLAGVWVCCVILFSALAFATWCKSPYVGIGIGVVYVLLSFFIFLRFINFRGKRTLLTYRYAVLAYRLIGSASEAVLKLCPLLSARYNFAACSSLRTTARGFSPRAINRCLSTSAGRSTSIRINA